MFLEFLFFWRLFGELHKVGFDKAIDVAVHHSIDIGGLIVGAMVFDTAVVEDIGANLTTPLYLLFARFDLGCGKAFSRFLGWSRVSVFSMTISSG